VNYQYFSFGVLIKNKNEPFASPYSCNLLSPSVLDKISPEYANSGVQGFISLEANIPYP